MEKMTQVVFLAMYSPLFKVLEINITIQFQFLFLVNFKHILLGIPKDLLCL